MDFNALIRSQIKRLDPYSPGKSAHDLGLKSAIKLSSNENPLGPCVPIEEWSSLCSNVHIYPSYSDHPIYSKLAKHHNVRPNQIVLGNGSDEVISMVASALLNPGDEVISADITFSQYAFATKMTGAYYRTIPLINWKYDLTGIQNAITDQTKLIFIANPNNPTGTVVPFDQWRPFLNAVPKNVVVVLDEAYVEYIDQKNGYPTYELSREFPNVIVTRTFSKAYGLAALRFGYGIGHPEFIEILNRIRQPFNVNGVALEVAVEALNRQAFIDESVRLNHEEKEVIAKELNRLKVDYVATDANFFCIHLNQSANIISKQLLHHGVIVRDLSSFGLNTSIRVTIGTPKENLTFLKALAAVID